VDVAAEPRIQLELLDNVRVLHGRIGYAASSRERLQGCYADRDGLRRTRAVLSRG